eukprot:746762-Hanusia_phi.AAC.5
MNQAHEQLSAKRRHETHHRDAGPLVIVQLRACALWQRPYSPAYLPRHNQTSPHPARKLQPPSGPAPIGSEARFGLVRSWRERERGGRGRGSRVGGRIDRAEKRRQGP